MLPRIASYVRHNIVGFLALFVALGGTGAYAANEWTGANIQNETLTGDDIRGKLGTSSVAAVNGTITSADVAGHHANSANGTPFVMGTLSGEDVRDNSLGVTDLSTNAVQTGEVTNGTLRPEDFAPGVLVRAYGHINSTTVTRSKNVVSVNIPRPGVSCITLAAGIDPTTSAPVATPDYASSSTGFTPNGNQTIVEIYGSDGSCASRQLTVFTGLRRVVQATDANGNVLRDGAGHPWVRSVDNVQSRQGFFFVLP